MVFFLAPVVTTIFTAVIGSVTLHFVDGNYNRRNRNSNPTRQEMVGIDYQTEEVSDVDLTDYEKQREKQKKRKENKQCERKNKKQSIELSREQSQNYKCFLTNKIIKHPAELMCGHSFEHQELLVYLKKNKKCPICEKKSRLSQIIESPELAEKINNYQLQKRVRKLSRDRLIQDFGDDKIDICWKHSEQEKAHSDTECCCQVNPSSKAERKSFDIL